MASFSERQGAGLAWPFVGGTLPGLQRGVLSVVDEAEQLSRFRLDGVLALETPGSIHEGGELGYSLSHAFGAAFDNPDLLVACVVGDGDGEGETCPLATSWHSNKFLNPVHDGAVLPILHLNGYKIAGPTVLARIPHAELDEYGLPDVFGRVAQAHRQGGA